MSQLLYDSLFAGPTTANATAGSAATNTTGAHDAPSPGTANQLVDTLGGGWSVDSSGVLHGLVGAAGVSGSRLIWPAADSAQAGRVVAWVPPAVPATVSPGVALRYTTANSFVQYYLARFTPATGAITIQANISGTLFDCNIAAAAGTISPAYNSAHTYRLDFSCTDPLGGSDTHLTFNVYNDTAGTLVGTVTGRDGSGYLTAPGVPALIAYASDTTPTPFTRAQVYSGALDTPAFTLSGTTHTSATFAFSGAGGGLGTLSSQLYRSVTPGFTPPGSGVAVGSPVTGGSGSVVDNAPPAGLNFYRLVTSDSSPTPQTVLSAEHAAATQQPALSLGFVGDSITYGIGATTGTNDAPTLVGQTLSAMYGDRTVAVSNQGQPGSITDWWVPGNSTNYLSTAKTAFAAAGVSVVHVMLGTNDSVSGHYTAASAYGTNLALIVNDLVTTGYKVVVSYPIFMTAGDPVQYGLVAQYQPQIDALVNNVTVFAGDKLGWQFFANHAALLGDGTHPTVAGYVDLADLWTPPIVKALGLSGATRVVAPLAHPFIGVTL